MDQKELEIAIGELEARVDRLRAMYDQYFMGYEKLEPTVPRKDVERRFVLLRKEQIRNTAVRFRLSVVTQKYNTYSMYWQRICRQIEEGTFKRHVKRAQQRFGKANRAADLSIEVDLGELEDVESMDVDALLAEADAAVASYKREAPDTVPPDPPSQPAPARGDFGAPPRTFVRATPAERSANPPSSQPALSPSSERTPRPAALPPGAKPRIVRRVVRDQDGHPVPAAPARPPPSWRHMPAAPPPSSRHMPAAPPPSSRHMPAAPPASSRRVPAAPPSSSRHVPAAPPAPGSSGALPPRPRPALPSQAGRPKKDG